MTHIRYYFCTAPNCGYLLQEPANDPDDAVCPYCEREWAQELETQPLDQQDDEQQGNHPPGAS